MNAPPLMDGKAITDFIRDWIERTKQSDNCDTLDEVVELGLCADLATVVWEHFGQPDDIKFRSSSDPVHTWIEYNGRHYDMQNPEGVDDWPLLAYFKDCTRVKLDE